LYKNSFITIVHHSERKNDLQTFLTTMNLPRSANKGSRNQHQSNLSEHSKQVYVKCGDVIPKK